MSFFPIYKKSYFLNACLRGAVGLALLGSSLAVESSKADFESIVSDNDIGAESADSSDWYTGIISETGKDENGNYLTVVPYETMRSIGLQGVPIGRVKPINENAQLVKFGFLVCCDAEGRSVPLSITTQAPLDSRTLKMYYIADADSEKMLESMKKKENRVTFKM